MPFLFKQYGSTDYVSPYNFEKTGIKNVKNTSTTHGRLVRTIAKGSGYCLAGPSGLRRKIYITGSGKWSLDLGGRNESFSRRKTRDPGIGNILAG
jgi:hypothetical protein